jgi:hypothetical protein
VTAALVRKELRQLLPVILGLASLLVWSEASAFLLHPPDQYLTEAEGWLLNSHAGRLEAVFTLIIGLVVAYNLLPGEHDQRTIEFLYTLPVRRRTLFLIQVRGRGGPAGGAEPAGDGGQHHPPRR